MLGAWLMPLTWQAARCVSVCCTLLPRAPVGDACTELELLVRCCVGAGRCKFAEVSSGVTLETNAGSVSPYLRRLTGAGDLRPADCCACLRSISTTHTGERGADLAASSRDAVTAPQTASSRTHCKA